jgi:hypothetical protein
MKGYAENAVCPRCHTYTQQRIVYHGGHVRRGERECLNCGTRFYVRDTERIQRGKTIKPDDGWLEVWASLDDAQLASTLFDYMWLAAKTPNSHFFRIAQLKAEAERRGKPELIQQAEARVAAAVAKKAAAKASAADE